MNKSFTQQMHLPVSAEEAFQWHGRAGALERLIPPWEPVQISGRGEGVQDDSLVKLQLQLGLAKLAWVAEHHDCRAGRSFRDTQASGLFAHWEHLQEIRANGDGNGVLTDHVEYRAADYADAS